jgi:hypothetical protein
MMLYNHNRAEVQDVVNYKESVNGKKEGQRVCQSGPVRHEDFACPAQL